MPSDIPVPSGLTIALACGVARVLPGQAWGTERQGVLAGSTLAHWHEAEYYAPEEAVGVHPRSRIVVSKRAQ
jgi:hypothetical protein